MNDTESAVSSKDVSPPQGIDVRDAAWARVPTGYQPDELVRELGDVEVLLRLNPYYYFSKLTKTAANSFHAEFENHSNDQAVSLDLDVESTPGGGITLNYKQGVKRRTIFSIEPASNGATLVVTDDYSGTPEEERKKRETEIDKSLTAWATAIQTYLVRLRRYSRLPGWRWYIRRIWIPMKPSGRRIVWLLYLITAVEFFFFCFIVLIYWVERHR